MNTHTVTIIGAGSWGTRIAHKLAARGDTRINMIVDADRSKAETLAASIGCDYSCSVLLDDDSTSVVIATPPHTHRDTVESVLDRITLPHRIRVEKPLAHTIEDAHYIIDAIIAQGITLTTGFTLLYSRLYETAIEQAQRRGHVISIDAERIGQKPAHDIDAMLDLGAHAACFGALLLADTSIRASYDAQRNLRRATWYLGDETTLVIDELEQSVKCSDCTIYVPAHDALAYDIDAWLNDTHLATPSLALLAQNILEQQRASV